MQLIRATWPLQTHTHTHIYSSFVWNCCPRRQAPCDITEKLCALFKGSPLKKHYLYSSLRKLIWYYHLLIAVSTGSRRPWHKNLSICHPSGPLSFHISLSVGWYTAVTCLFEMTCVSQIIYHLVPHNVSEKFTRLFLILLFSIFQDFSLRSIHVILLENRNSVAYRFLTTFEDIFLHSQPYIQVDGSIFLLIIIFSIFCSIHITLIIYIFSIS